VAPTPPPPPLSTALPSAPLSHPPPPPPRPNQVDGVLSKVDATIAYSREIHSKNMSSFSTAKESAFSTVEGLVNATKAALDPQRYYNYAASLSKKLITAVAAYSDPDKVVAAACTAYDKVASRAPGESRWARVVGVTWLRTICHLL